MFVLPNNPVKTKTRGLILMCAAISIISIVSTVVIIMNLSGGTAKNKTVIDAKAIEESVRSISRLSTLTYSYSNVGIFEEQKMISLFGNEIGVPGTKKSFIITYDGEMSFGIDLSQVSITEKNGVLNVKLPPAQMLSHTILEDSIKLLDEKNGLFSSFSVTDYSTFVVEQKEKMETRALDGNLLLQAQANAETQIKAFILLIPGVASEYEINIFN